MLLYAACACGKGQLYSPRSAFPAELAAHDPGQASTDDLEPGYANSPRTARKIDLTPSKDVPVGFGGWCLGALKGRDVCVIGSGDTGAEDRADWRVNPLARLPAWLVICAERA